jgi:hypothetical protein
MLTRQTPSALGRRAQTLEVSFTELLIPCRMSLKKGDRSHDRIPPKKRSDAGAQINVSSGALAVLWLPAS